MWDAISQRTAYLRLLGGFCLLLLGAPLAAQKDAGLASIQALLDRGEGTQALTEVQRVIKKNKKNAEAYLLRSTAYAMLGDPAKAFEDLQTSVKLDPALRQAWLNIAGLEIAERRYEAALDALLKAEALAPSAVDNHLNIGAVLIFMQRVEEAGDRFRRYLAAHPNDAEAAYLVATNYALAGHESHAIDNLRTTFQLDERRRLKARADERFLGLEGDAYRELLNTDFYSPPAGSHTAARAFKTLYRRRNPRFVYAVLDALKQNGIYYDPSIETSDRWALVWGEMRIKIYNQESGNGVVSLSAPANAYSAGEWKVMTDAIFRSIYDKLKSSPIP